jgi:hypothetical protein
MQQVIARDDILATRTCGKCTACCRFLPIVEPTLTKPMGVLCQHCKPNQGCTVYDLRPAACRGWNCGWRKLPNLAPSWRPDKSGIMLRMDGDPFADGVTVSLIGGAAALRNKQLEPLISSWIRAGIKVFLQCVGAPGFLPSLTLLNPLIDEFVRSGDGQSVTQALREIHDAVQRQHVWERDGLEHRSSVLGGQPLTVTAGG